MSHDLVLGLGGCVDFEVAWDAALLEELAREHGIRADELDTGLPVEDERSLLRSILAFVRDGSGGERFIASSDIAVAFASRLPYKVSLGGTAVRAALAVAKLGVPSLAHLVSIDDNVRRLLAPEIEYLCSAVHDSLDPHLIIQFPAGATVRLNGGEVRSPHPNRIIYVNDPPAEQMVLSPDLPDALAGARGFLVSGLNVIRDPGLLRERLGFLRDAMLRLPADAVAYYEDAGFHDVAMRAVVSSEFRGRVDVHSLNEDELQSYLGRRIDLLDDADVASAMADFRRFAIAPTVVVHTKYWSLAHGERAGDYAGALAGGIDLASTRYCHGDEFTATELAAVRQVPVQPAGAQFAVRIAERLGGGVRCLPGRQLEVAEPTTIGLGDTFVGGFLAAVAKDSNR